ncbi:hypothetical protein [Alsobacter sp. R-9]
MKSLDAKLERIRAGRYTAHDFIIADAKDGDMGFGLPAPGPRPGDGVKTKADYLDAMRDMTRSGLVDIMLMSASTAETLAGEGLFAGHPVTPAVRLNDTTDIWSQRHGAYKASPSRPFRTASIPLVAPFADLGLYSVTFMNDQARDLESLEAYRAFRAEALALGMRHFLEVFNPAIDIGIADDGLGDYVNDCIIRALAGVVSAEQPLFLKMQYNGPRAMEELAAYDPARVIVGILGGAKGTTRDTFELVGQAERHGARVALFGRKINLAEAPVALVGLMRRVVAREVTAEEAVKAYHAELGRLGLRPTLPLERDIVITDPVLKAG